ncbi:hypothetical protein PVK06_016331 [Gossypium arboreum]|uniref:Reverse transcriptase n=1 Tax=Gossypium arboreum TaxID=29729 RepID=A0ABR0Q051_GOSAR|nr:hypothetical protein PVK06_016331 [Gossypium arboreum]
MEAEFAGLTINEKEEAILQVQIEPNPKREVGAFRLVGCFLIASIIHFPAMKDTMANLWHPLRGVQIQYMGEKRVEVAEMGWDLSLRVQSRTALVMTSVWLREEGEGEWEDVEERNKWRSTGFYGSPYSQDRVEAWNLLRQLGNIGGIPWMVCEDFNEIMYGFEKKGGIPREEGRTKAFSVVLEKYSLMDMGLTGNWFTWERRNLPETNIEECLDRGVANADWFSLFPEFQAQHLSHSFSDHCPLFIITKRKDKQRIQRSYKFEAWWVLEESFFTDVRNIWENSKGDLLNKLESVKRGLKS